MQRTSYDGLATRQQASLRGHRCGSLAQCCESAPDCFFMPRAVAVVPADAPSEPQVDVEALVTADDPCWGA